MSPSPSGPTRTDVRVRELRSGDVARVSAIDAHHTGREERASWQSRFDEFLGPARGRVRIGLGADLDGALAGYLLGEVRAFEFGSEACGWIFAVGVAPERLRGGVASALLEEAARRFREAGVTRMRTMVGRNDVPVLSFFRSNRFRGGSFVQLERTLSEER